MRKQAKYSSLFAMQHGIRFRYVCFDGENFVYGSPVTSRAKLKYGYKAVYFV